jgi:hypothetical protein
LKALFVIYQSPAYRFVNAQERRHYSLVDLWRLANLTEKLPNAANEKRKQLSGLTLNAGHGAHKRLPKFSAKHRSRSNDRSATLHLNWQLMLHAVTPSLLDPFGIKARAKPAPFPRPALRKRSRMPWTSRPRASNCWKSRLVRAGCGN